eukprot:3297220-Rhodomonas_salina.4
MRNTAVPAADVEAWSAQGPQVGPGGARSAAPPSPPKGAAASPLRAMPGADAASGTPTSPGLTPRTRRCCQEHACAGGRPSERDC